MLYIYFTAYKLTRIALSKVKGMHKELSSYAKELTVETMLINEREKKMNEWLQILGSDRIQRPVFLSHHTGDVDAMSTSFLYLQ